MLIKLTCGPPLVGEVWAMRCERTSWYLSTVLVLQGCLYQLLDECVFSLLLPSCNCGPCVKKGLAPTTTQIELIWLEINYFQGKSILSADIFSQDIASQYKHFSGRWNFKPIAVTGTCPFPVSQKPHFFSNSERPYISTLLYILYS